MPARYFPAFDEASSPVLKCCVPSLQVAESALDFSGLAQEALGTSQPELKSTNGIAVTQRAIVFRRFLVSLLSQSNSH
jgi:hypothetical protein